MRLSVSISPVLVCLRVLAPFALLFRAGFFLIVCVINFLLAFEENSICGVQNYPDWVIKNNWSGISKFPRTVYSFSYYFIWRHDVNNWGSIFIPKIRRTSYNILPVKILVCYISQTIRRTLKNILFWLEAHLMYIHILQKSQFRYFDPFQCER